MYQIQVIAGGSTYGNGFASIVNNTTPNIITSVTQSAPCNYATNSVCVNINTALTRPLLSQFTIDWGDGNTDVICPGGPVCSSIICHTYGAPGAYTIQLVPNEPSPCPLPTYPIFISNLVVSIPGPLNYCAGTGLQNFAVNSTGGKPNLSYAWSSGVIQPTGTPGTFTFNTGTGSTGTYTVTVTDANGCTATASVYVNVLTSCCTGSTINCSGTNRTLTYAGAVNASTIWADVCGTISGTTRIIDLSVFGADKRIAINGNLTINGDYMFKNCTYTANNPNTWGGITFAPGVKVSIPNGSKLTVENSYLFACGNQQWAGIEVAAGGTLITQSTNATSGFPIIADANVAVNGVSGAIGTINLNNTRFYRNWVGVNIPAATNYAGTINGCIFSYNAADPLQNYQLFPHTGKRTAVGIFANNMTSGFGLWQINNSSGAPNIFERINNGIYAYRSNVQVNNNVFNYIWNYDNIGPYCGNGVYAISLTGSQNSIIVQTNSIGATPAFKSCLCGVFLNNVYALVKNNYMLDDTSGIYATSCPNTSLDFNGNEIIDTYAGITFNSVNSSLVRTVQAYNNDIRVREPYSFAMAPNATYPNSYGIGHFETSNAAVTCADGSTNCRVLIEFNTIDNGRYCVYVNNAYGTRITDNTLRQVNTVSTPGYKAGVFVSAGFKPLITVNHFSGQYDTYDETSATNAPNRRNGVFITNTQSSELCNNDFDMVGYGMQFQGNCSQTKLIQNAFSRSKYGIVLKHNGVTPTAFRYQGEFAGDGLSHGNTFTGPFNNAGNFQTYTFNSNGGIHRFWIKNAANNLVQPYPNGADVVGYEFKKEDIVSTEPWVCSTQPGGWKSMIINQGDVYTKEVAEGDGNKLVAEGFEESGEWMLEKDLYTRLKTEPELLQSKQLFKDFYETADQTSIGDISRYEDAALSLSDTTLVKDSLELDAQIETVLAANRQIQATNEYEYNRKWVNELYLHTLAKGNINFSNTEKEQLLNLASQCPFIGGDAVYVARSIYNVIDHNALFDDEQICKAAQLFKKEHKSPEAANSTLQVKISPNPASSYVEISVTGEDGELELAVYNALGQLMGFSNFTKVAEIVTADMPNGVYQVCIRKNNELLKTGRLIIAK